VATLLAWRLGASAYVRGVEDSRPTSLSIKLFSETLIHPALTFSPLNATRCLFSIPGAPGASMLLPTTPPCSLPKVVGVFLLLPHFELGNTFLG